MRDKVTSHFPNLPESRDKWGGSMWLRGLELRDRHGKGGDSVLKCYQH